MKGKDINIISLISLILTLNYNFTQAQDRITGHNFTTRSEVIAKNGMVATSHPLATQIGLDILKNGGNAIDAAIGANAALGLMEPTGCGIGCDLFVIIWSMAKETPESESRNLFLTRLASQTHLLVPTRLISAVLEQTSYNGNPKIKTISDPFADIADFRSPRRPLPHIQDVYNRKGFMSHDGNMKKVFFVLKNFIII